jgi:uncharacterized protein YlxW (UPF0749 family)
LRNIFLASSNTIAKIVRIREVDVPRKTVFIALAALIAAALFSGACAYADPVPTNEELLREIRDLKRTVESQQKKIEALEQRVIRTETSTQTIGVPASSSDIDKRIDERLSARAPGYQLMEGLSMGIETTTIGPRGCD